jgi:hypothetical protein
MRGSVGFHRGRRARPRWAGGVAAVAVAIGLVTYLVVIMTGGEAGRAAVTPGAA